MSNDNTQQRGSTTSIEVGDETDESYRGGKDKDVVDLGGGDDTIAGGGRHYNIILGGSGNDHLTSQALLDEVFGGSGNDTIIATGRGGWLYGGSGNDTITGSDKELGFERIDGGSGDDTIDGRGGADHIIGGADNDTLTGGDGGDTFFFSEEHGNDTITDFNAAEGDLIYLRHFDQTITWEQLQSAIATVTGDDGAVTGVRIDLTQWGGGTIVLEGVTSVSDLTEDMFRLHRLTGSDGVDDWLGSGTGDHTLTGGTGADTFAFDRKSGDDTVTDFNAAEGDRIDLEGFIGTPITWKQLQAAMTQVEDDASTPDVDETATVIDLGAWGGGKITLLGVTPAELTEDNFLLSQHVINGLDGTEGDDTLDGTGEDDEMFGMEGDDTLLGGKGKDWLFGGEGEDTLYGGKGGDWLLGGEGKDTLYGGKGDDRLFGGEGNDELHGAKGVDLLIGGTGDDKLYGGKDNDVLDGGGGVDTFVFQENHGSDTILDFDTNLDKIDLSDLAQTVTWEKLQAAITATANSDGAVTGARIDLSEWGGGTVTLMGVAPTDLTEDMFILDDNPVADLAGDDIMTGGEGADTFVFAGAHGNDTITNFTDGEDLIDLSAFANIAKFGDLAATQVGDDVRIDLSDHGGGTITLQDFTLGDLDETDFVFQTSSQDVQDGM